MLVPLAGFLALTLLGCESPRSAEGTPSLTRSPSSSPQRSGPATNPPRSTPTRAVNPTPTFGETVAVSCAGHPTADQVIALLRRRDLVPSGATITVQTQPLCAGMWQYTVVSVPEREPLQVITRGAPAALELVTAGTDVCSIPVRTGAPFGIQALAMCG